MIKLRRLFVGLLLIASSIIYSCSDNMEEKKPNKSYKINVNKDTTELHDSGEFSSLKKRVDSIQANFNKKNSHNKVGTKVKDSPKDGDSTK